MKQISLFLFIFLLIGSQSCTKNEETQDQEDQRLIQQYLSANNITNAKSTSSGLHYIIEEQGTGLKPGINDQIKFFYVGKLLSGQIFDSSDSLTIDLDQLIDGFQEGIPLINEAGKITLIIPSSLGYGSQGSALIPANSVLIFNVELIDVIPD
jgi:FKBP-type peptidyl-prolyl cis-trans isomerase FkpA